MYSARALLVGHLLAGLLGGLAAGVYDALAATTDPANPETAGLLLGAIGLISIAVITQKEVLLLSMVGVGIAWASILSMPYAMLSNCLPAEKMGFYMGVFNFFIVLPQITIALGLGEILAHFPQIDSLWVVVGGGVCFLLAALLTLRVLFLELEATCSIPLVTMRILLLQLEATCSIPLVWPQFVPLCGSVSMTISMRL